MIKKILIANRGEIAVRIIKACRELGITSAAVYSEIDKNSMHVRIADEVYLIGPAQASESYLNREKIITLAKKISADAIHPGYGFLSENSEFIKNVRNENLIFIGPSAQSVELMGDKTEARKLMKSNNVPVVPGTVDSLNSLEEAKQICRDVGYPVMIKAKAGGGGKGMRKVSGEDDLQESIERAQSEALKAFGNSDVYIEKFIESPKHIEVQILADTHGNYIHLFERECSIQRRHQKIIEEAPSISLNDKIRKQITQAAIEAAKACNYYNAGTIEFLMDQNKHFYFLEMNTRIQVEHPVTELMTGIDLVKEQIKIANGEKLSFKQDDIKINNHAIECRIYAEDTDNNFSPSTGRIIHHRLPSGSGIRVDRGIDLQSEVSVYYDPLLSKVISYGSNRTEAIERMKRGLGEYQVAGVITNIPLCNWILENELFISGEYDINFVERELMPLIPGKWKSNINDEYENVVSILAALLKHKENELKPQNSSSQNNNWIENNNE
ncbi:MAG: acetyl-CoA carboxylase biotin carboxylase subunit [Ignavibacteria bacterium]|jgi:acetyl-CoA carboxylase biotin carboxylase subunit